MAWIGLELHAACTGACLARPGPIAPQIGSAVVWDGSQVRFEGSARILREFCKAPRKFRGPGRVPRRFWEGVVLLGISPELIIFFGGGGRVLSLRNINHQKVCRFFPFGYWEPWIEPLVDEGGVPF